MKIAATTEEIGIMAWVAAGALCAFGQFLIVIIIGMIVIIIIIDGYYNSMNIVNEITDKITSSLFDHNADMNQGKSGLLKSLQSWSICWQYIDKNILNKYIQYVVNKYISYIDKIHQICIKYTF